MNFKWISDIVEIKRRWGRLDTVTNVDRLDTVNTDTVHTVQTVICHHDKLNKN